MTVPFVAAFSASCSRNGTVAPRPATSAGSRAARVTTGAPGGVFFGGGAAEAADPPARTPIVRDAAATAARRVLGRVIVDSLRPGGRAPVPARRQSRAD